MRDLRLALNQTRKCRLARHFVIINRLVIVNCLVVSSGSLLPSCIILMRYEDVLVHLNCLQTYATRLPVCSL